MKLQGIAYIELWVEDAFSVANSYEHCFGFERIAEASPGTGLEGHFSVILKQGDALFIITSSLNTESPVANFVLKHGDGVRDIAFKVDNSIDSFNRAIEFGAVPVSNQNKYISNYTAIHAFGDVIHSFVDENRLPSWFQPTIAYSNLRPKFFIEAIDHVAISLNTGQLDEVVDFYKRVLGFEEGQTEYIETEYSGMNSKVVMHNAIKFPLQEPLKNNPSGPIFEFIQLNGGAGVYHVALLSNDIYKTIRCLPSRVNVLDVPDTYYEQLFSRVGKIQESIHDLKELKILVDGDPNSYLMQVFTRSMHKRRTFYIEIIQRVSHDGFGSGNVRALFDAIEADRMKLGQELYMDRC